MTTLMAVDPGKTTGWAVYDIPSQEPVYFGETKESDFNTWALEWAPKIRVWVVEDYFVRPASMKASGFDHTWDKGMTFRKIGKLEIIAYWRGAEFVLQQPSQKPLAYKHAGMEYKKGKKGMHVFDAIAHGKLYLVKNYGLPNVG